MKKKGLILLTMTLSVGMMMVGCKSETPTDSVNAYFSSIKKSDTQEAQKLIESTIPSDALNEKVTSSSDTDKTSEESSKLDDELNESLKVYLSKMNAKVLSQKVNDDKATVEVKISAPNYSNLLLEVMKESEESSLSGKDVSAEDVEKCLEDKIKNSENETRTGTINLTKKDNKWEIKSDDEMINLLLGEADETESVMFTK